MADGTNGNIPTAGANLSGEMARLYAIKRLQKQAQPGQAPGPPGQPIKLGKF